MFVFSLKYNVFPVEFMAELLMQLFKDFGTDYSQKPIFLGTSEGRKKTEALKPAAMKEAVIRLRSGSGSAY